MADHTDIEWTDATWNPITGCSITSPGCTNCYAMRLAGTRLAHHSSRAGLTQDTKAGPAWTGEVRLNEQWLHQPLSWRRPRRIFACAHGDLFHENVPDEWIDRVFAVMALAPQHTFQVLTKRAERMHRYLTIGVTGPWAGRMHRVDDDGALIDAGDAWRRINASVVGMLRHVPPQQLNFAAAYQEPHGDGFLPRWPLPNVWLGGSVEDQRRADERLPWLTRTPAAIRWVSAEPLFEAINLNPWLHTRHGQHGLDWVVAGGESSPNARPMHPDWARSLRDQCAAANVPFLFKQWGEWGPIYDRDHDDPDWQRCDTVSRADPRGRWMNLKGGHGFHGDRVIRMSRVGKKAAGRLLDGVLHDGYPDSRP